VNHVLTCSSAQTTKVTIKPIQTSVYFGNTDLTESGILKNMQKFVKTENNQFIHLWTASKYDYQRHKSLFSKRLKKQSDSEYNSQNKV